MKTSGEYIMPIQQVSLRYFSIILGIFLVFSTNYKLVFAQDDKLSPYTVQANILGIEDLLQSHTASVASTSPEARPASTRIKPFTVRFVLAGEGRVRASFTVRKNKTWRSYFSGSGGLVEDKIEPILLQGTVKIGGSRVESAPVAASIIGERLKITLFGRSRGYGGRSYTVTMPLTKLAKGKVSSLPSAALRSKTCGNDANASSFSANTFTNSPSKNVHTKGLRELQIATDTDFEYYTRFTTTSNAEIAGYINTMQALYNRDLGLNPVVAFQIVRSSSSNPYLSTDSTTLLNQYRTGWDQGYYDANFMFSGKDLDGSTIGIAYVGVTCAFPSYSFGVTQFYSNAAATMAVLAHELGHNLNLSHDADNNSVMSAALYNTNPGAMYFSSNSISAATAYINASGSCLTETGASPTATPTPTPVGPEPTATPPPSENPTPEPTVAPTPIPGSYSVSIAAKKLGKTKQATVYTVSGKVIHKETSTPASGILVRFINARTGTRLFKTTTDVDGKYTITVGIKFGSKIFIRTDATIANQVFTSSRVVTLTGVRR